jgi:iron complex outermembrane receptor protein
MSESMSTSNYRAVRRRLLTTVCALALLASVTSREAAAEDDADRPTVWIELGGEMDRQTGQGDAFTPGFVAANPNSPVLVPVSPVQAQNPSPFEFAEYGRISFQPESTNWVFSAAVNYGRSSNFKHVDHQTNAVHYAQYNNGAPLPSLYETEVNFADTTVHHQESHAVIDFSVGKDVGLGLFGRNGSSVLNFGIRFAEFASKATFEARARPDVHIKYYPSAHAPHRYVVPYFNTYHATGSATRSFHGIGPSLSWNGSTPFAGNLQGGEATFDWGANAALLFGRQKASVRHQESAHYESPNIFNGITYTLVYQHPPAGHDTRRLVVVPNVGGFAGASWRVQNFKVSLGYRADLFFGAMDGGIDTRKSENVGFYGPFASVSVGIGG